MRNRGLFCDRCRDTGPGRSGWNESIRRAGRAVPGSAAISSRAKTTGAISACSATAYGTMTGAAGTAANGVGPSSRALASNRGALSSCGLAATAEGSAATSSEADDAASAGWVGRSEESDSLPTAPEETSPGMIGAPQPEQNRRGVTSAELCHRAAPGRRFHSGDWWRRREGPVALMFCFGSDLDGEAVLLAFRSR